MNKTLALITVLLAWGLGAAPLHAASIEAGKARSKACITCHGKHGISSNPDYPNIAGQTEGYLVKTLREFRSGRRKDPSMNRVANALSDADIADLSAYYASLPHH